MIGGAIDMQDNRAKNNWEISRQKKLTEYKAIVGLHKLKVTHEGESYLAFIGHLYLGAFSTLEAAQGALYNEIERLRAAQDKDLADLQKVSVKDYIVTFDYHQKTKQIKEIQKDGERLEQSYGYWSFRSGRRAKLHGQR